MDWIELNLNFASATNSPRGLVHVSHPQYGDDIHPPYGIIIML